MIIAFLSILLLAIAVNIAIFKDIDVKEGKEAKL